MPTPEKENPYQISPAVSQGQQNWTDPCIRCGSTHILTTDPRFPKLQPHQWLLHGWITLPFRYAFRMPQHTCQNCGTRIHHKPLGSLIAMILILLSSALLIQFLLSHKP
jgi:hypothetical protein